MNPINQILEPFREIDIASTYQQNYLFIDFVIYLLIFVGLSKFVFSKRFSGNGGKAISVGVGLILSLSMSVFSYTTGFSIGSFGPIAAIILMLLVGMLLFGFIRQIGGNTVNSGIGAFIVTYFLMRSVTPEIYDWVAKRSFAAWIDAVLMLSIPYLVYLLIRKFIPSLSSKNKNNIMGSFKNREIEKVKDNKLTNLENMEELEKASYKTEKKVDKKEKLITKNLKSIISLLQKENPSPEVTNNIVKILTDLQNQDNEQLRLLNQLKLLNKKLSNWHINGFKQLSRIYNKLSFKDKKNLKEAIQREQTSIIENRQIENIEKQINQYYGQYLKQINLGINQLGHKNKRGALYYLLQAQQTEQNSHKLLKQLKTMQRQLLQLTMGEIEAVKKLAA
ncbi:MAG: hypothetical protein DRP35_08210 [Candidatus Zixiibacteriota bacterium]|nr:MAG: hypothetical protein DRP35_08210 [candidate division Zixibacteria bacterium]